MLWHIAAKRRNMLDGSAVRHPMPCERSLSHRLIVMSGGGGKAFRATVA